MKLDSEHIASSDNYRKISELDYDHIIGFVFENIRNMTRASKFYFFINICTLILILYFLIAGLGSDILTFGEFLRQLALGLLGGSLIVIPFHEGFHGLAYKIAGAPKIHFGADLKQMIFYVSAHKYVIGRKQFYFVALAPFVMINIILLAIYFLTGWPGLHTVLFFLLFHNIMCIGDFAMISFYQKHDEKELFTFDDLEKRVSYIYERF